MARRARGPGARHEENRREIAEAVLAVVAEHGLPAVSLTTVAARAVVSPGRVQHYFATKKELLAAAFEHANAQSSARIRAKAGQDLDAAEPRTVLTVVLTELIPYDDATRLHMRVRQSFTALALADADIAARLRAEYAGLHGRVADLLRRDQAAGRAAPRDPHEAAMALVGLAEGLAYYVLIGLTPAQAAREQVLAAIDSVYV
jgi:AcrR family transcriptional regulator